VPARLARIKNFIINNPTTASGMPRQFFGAGDEHQNAPICEPALCFSNTPTGRAERKAYYNYIATTIFPYHITLKESKRLSDPQQRAVLYDIVGRVLTTQEPLLDIAKRFFKPISSWEEVAALGGISVCLLNYTAEHINTVVQALNTSTMDPALLSQHGARIYYAGMRLICRRRYKSSKVVIPPNYLFTVRSFSATGCVLYGPFELQLTYAELSDHFQYFHSHTCASLQGVSVSGAIILFDLRHYHASREHFYTALTRGRDLRRIYYWDPTVELDAEHSAYEARLVAHMEESIKGYVAQDVAKGRTWTEGTYVDVDAIRAMLAAQGGGDMCADCGSSMCMFWDREKAPPPHGYVVDRLCNAKAHIKGNFRVVCQLCNKRKH
jgi:hypothetical protein